MVLKPKTKTKKQLKPCLAAVGVGASVRLHEPHFSSDTDGRRSTSGCGASRSQAAIGRSVDPAPVTGPQRGSAKV